MACATPTPPRNVQDLVTQEAEFHPKPLGPELSRTLQGLFPNTYGQACVTFKAAPKKKHTPLKVGVVLSGGQAPGGHNVIAGLFDALKRISPHSSLIGFRNGPSGLLGNKYIRITAEVLDKYRNTGGFDIIGSGRTKISTLEQFKATALTLEAQDLDGLVIVGGDDSNTNAALLAEYFREQKLKTRCVGVPKTIDGDLAGEHIETSFGFDTCAKTYANEIANIQVDARSSAKYWFFIKVMGRSASHLALECALQTHPNMTLISEEIKDKAISMHQLIEDIADMVQKRAQTGKDYGVLLIPEGLLEFIPEFEALIQELNHKLITDINVTVLKALRKPRAKVDYVDGILSEASHKVFTALPRYAQFQLILDRDPHGNVNVSLIDTEKLLGDLVGHELGRRKEQGVYKGDFKPIYHFCGFQGRSAYPTNFDCKYGYALGHVAAALLSSGCTGLMSAVKNLNCPTSEWVPCGVPITSMMNIEVRHGKPKPVIKKALVDSDLPKFKEFVQLRSHWVLQDAYRHPGPIQFSDMPAAVLEETNFNLKSRL